jgi:A/G-specific adenine glycosylase
LILKVLIAKVPQDVEPDMGHFIERSAFRPSDLPTVMRKAYDLAAK